MICLSVIGSHLLLCPCTLSHLHSFILMFDCRSKIMHFTYKKILTYGIVYLNKSRNLLKGKTVSLNSKCSMLTKFIMLITGMIRCIDDTEQHLDQSVLSKLPHGFKSHLKQSSLSLADDMGKLAILCTS